MGFPVRCADVLFYRLIAHLLTVVGLMRKTTSALLSFVGLRDSIELEIPYNDHMEEGSEQQSVSSVLLRELLPVVKYSELIDPPEGCAVCLSEFREDDEIRSLMNCRHVFHRSCVDRWMDHDQKTCPLCRTVFIPDDMPEVFNESLWLASGILEFYGDCSPVSADF